jgi:methylated-DNA-[protein]-cysteine S-methyltransferase
MSSFDRETDHIGNHIGNQIANHTDDLGAVFAALSSDEGRALARLHDRLVAAAARERVLDVGYRLLDTPVGSLLLAATEQGLVRVAYPREDHDAVLATLGRLVSPRILRAPGRLDEVCRQLEEYFAGARTAFELPLDLRLSTGFRRAVLAHLAEIGYGRTESYAQVAAAAGSPKAVRAAGTACATNPLPVVLPCHRVVRSDGSVGQYVGGPEVKLMLLRLERGERAGAAR